MKLLELVMITKNSGEILRKCLKHNKQYIDHWTILDTGSVDNTPEIIKDELKDIPGNLYFEDFVDFSTSRNRSLELSSKTCKYTIILDDSYIIQGGKKLLKLLKKSDDPCFATKIGNYYNGFLQNSYFSKRVIKSSCNLKFKYRVHEEIDIERYRYIEDNDIFINDFEFDEHKRRSFRRFKKDIEMLLLEHKDKPTDPKVIYYLGKTYGNINKIKEALIYYKKLENLKNLYIEYKFSALYDSACLRYKDTKDVKQFKQELRLVNIQFKDRPEGFFKLAVILKTEGNIVEADELISKIILYPRISNAKTIIEHEIQEYFIPYFYIEIKIILKQLDKAVPVLKKMLNLYPNNQPLLNIKYMICDNENMASIRLSDDKTLVIHTGGEKSIVKNWNPKGDKRISGSEFMAINLGKEFHKLGYRVFIIGSFHNDEEEIDYQCIYENIQYIDYKFFSEFCLKYVIDYLIVSRYVSDLIYYDNVKRVYLWVHDQLPIMSDNSAKCIQNHTKKFKGFITVSEWQKKHVMNELDIPENNFIMSRNAIYTNRFVGKNVEKTPFRFIYSSSPDRGLSYLMDMIPKIKERYPETTLYIFANKELIDIDTLKIVESLDYVILRPRIKQEELAIEFLKSDIWLYPTDFEETYCITALEAMAAKCLIATVDFCGLGNIVQGKGIVCEEPIEENINDLLTKLFFVLDKKSLKEYFTEKAYNWAIEQTYENLASEWERDVLSK